MRFEVCCINHQAFRTACLLCQPDEDPVKDTEAAPPDEAIIQSLVRTIRFRSVFPLKAVADYINDPAQNTTVVHSWHTMRKREKRVDPLHLLLRKQKHVTHRLNLHR